MPRRGDVRFHRQEGQGQRIQAHDGEHIRDKRVEVFRLRRGVEHRQGAEDSVCVVVAGGDSVQEGSGQGAGYTACTWRGGGLPALPYMSGADGGGYVQVSV